VEAILEAAERVLRSDGYGAASTNRVARVAGFSVGSLYQYFGDKQAVIGALLDQALRAEAERIARLLDEVARHETAAALERVVRGVLAERRSKAHLLRVLDAHAAELCAEPPLLHVLRIQAGVIAGPLHRLAAAHLASAGAGFDEALAVASRFVHVLGYALAVDAPDALDADAIAAHAAAALARYAEPAPLASTELRLDGAVPAFADATGRAHRLREARSALLRIPGLQPAALEPTAFLVSALTEATAELRMSLDPTRIEPAAKRLLDACLPET
jgi:AcrR family transcriptional regulator